MRLRVTYQDVIVQYIFTTWLGDAEMRIVALAVLSYVTEAVLGDSGLTYS